MVGLLHATKIHKELAPFQNWESSVRFQDDPWMMENTVSSQRKIQLPLKAANKGKKPTVAARASKENLNISLFRLILAPDCIFILFQLENYTVFL